MRRRRPRAEAASPNKTWATRQDRRFVLSRPQSDVSSLSLQSLGWETDTRLFSLQNIMLSLDGVCADVLVPPGPPEENQTRVRPSGAGCPSDPHVGGLAGTGRGHSATNSCSLPSRPAVTSCEGRQTREFSAASPSPGAVGRGSYRNVFPACHFLEHRADASELSTQTVGPDRPKRTPADAVSVSAEPVHTAGPACSDQPQGRSTHSHGPRLAGPPLGYTPPQPVLPIPPLPSGAHEQSRLLDPARPAAQQGRRPKMRDQRALCTGLSELRARRQGQV